MDFDGILLVDKPAGWTSFDVVAKVRSVLKHSTGNKIKVGHTGTLDPLATGLLIITVGSCCKRAGEFSKLDKTYLTEAILGFNSSTGDNEGEKAAVSGDVPPKKAVLAVLEAFTGEISQVPPVYSAIKVDGRRAYKMAREGKPVTLEKRQVFVNSLKLNKYDYPLLEFTADVGSGTYIRSLVQDIGTKLGAGAYTSGLRRTKVGEFEVEDAIKNLKTLTGETIYSSLRAG